MPASVRLALHLCISLVFATQPAEETTEHEVPTRHIGPQVEVLNDHLNSATLVSSPTHVAVQPSSAFALLSTERTDANHSEVGSQQRAMAGIEISDNYMIFLYGLIDTDGSGGISKNEWDARVKGPWSAPMYSRFSNDGNDEISIKMFEKDWDNSVTVAFKIMGGDDCPDELGAEWTFDPKTSACAAPGSYRGPCAHHVDMIALSKSEKAKWSQLCGVNWRKRTGKHKAAEGGKDHPISLKEIDRWPAKKTKTDAEGVEDYELDLAKSMAKEKPLDRSLFEEFIITAMFFRGLNLRGHTTVSWPDIMANELARISFGAIWYFDYVFGSDGMDLQELFDFFTKVKVFEISEPDH